MTCPQGGDFCVCNRDSCLASGRFEPGPGETGPERPRFIVDPQLQVPDESPGPLDKNEVQPPARVESEGAHGMRQEESAEQADASRGGDAWRHEVSARLHRYRARRRPRGPRYPSLRLKFETPAPKWTAPVAAEPGEGGSPALLSARATRQAVAVDQSELAEAAAREPVELAPLPKLPPTTGGKILEFPQSSFDPPLPLSELAEAVIDRPRILEAPEVMPPPPALGGIIIEEVPEKPQERRPGIDMPLQSAPARRRLLAAGVDGVILAMAGGMFAAIVYRMLGALPARAQLMGLAAGLGGLLWGLYQYLLVVYSGTTPGLRLAKLRVNCFDGRPANRSLRRWRVLASLLSGMALGLGYAWHFFDEDALCWHDRVTRTYLAAGPQSDTPSR